MPLADKCKHIFIIKVKLFNRSHRYLEFEILGCDSQDIIPPSVRRLRHKYMILHMKDELILILILKYQISKNSNNLGSKNS